MKATIGVPLARLSILPGRQARDAAIAVFVAMIDANMRETAVRMFVHRVKAHEWNESVQSLALHVPPGRYTVSFAIADAYSWQASFLQREITVP